VILLPEVLEGNNIKAIEKQMVASSASATVILLPEALEGNNKKALEGNNKNN
jgi:hypothetical protein